MHMPVLGRAELFQEGSGTGRWPLTACQWRQGGGSHPSTGIRVHQLPAKPSWDAMQTPDSQQAHNQQVVVAASQRVQPVGGQPPNNGYSCSHEASGISADNPEVCGK